MLTLWLSAALTDELPRHGSGGRRESAPSRSNLGTENSSIRTAWSGDHRRLGPDWTSRPRVSAVDGLILTSRRENPVQGWLSLMVCEEDSDLAVP